MAGFSLKTWEQFGRDGYLTLPKQLTATEVRRILAAIEDIQQQCGRPHDGLSERNAVILAQPFHLLIDHPGYFPYLYNVYGEALKLISSHLVVRPPRQKENKRNSWHFDGPRQVHFRLFSPKLPLRIKVGIWLTDLPAENMGNLIILPGSHRDDYHPEYQTHTPIEGEYQIRARAGDIVLLHEGIWHRVAENRSTDYRQNFFLEYGPSWLQTADRYTLPKKQLRKMSKRQRIIMRAYEHPNFHIKVPREDLGFMNYNDDDLRIKDNQMRDRKTWLEHNGLC